MYMADNNQNNRNKDRNGKMSVEEAGRKGGEATSANHDKEFYEKIGRKGGETSGNRNRSSENDSNK